MPCRPSTSHRSTCLPLLARASASADATVDLPVPPLPVTTCSRTFDQSLTRVSVAMTAWGRSGRSGGELVRQHDPGEERDAQEHPDVPEDRQVRTLRPVVVGRVGRVLAMAWEPSREDEQADPDL